VFSWAQTEELQSTLISREYIEATEGSITDGEDGGARRSHPVPIVFHLQPPMHSVNQHKACVTNLDRHLVVTTDRQHK
jgi:hypothetical protein